MASGDLSSKPESLITEYIHDELTEKNEVTEEIPKSACDEQTQATINTSTGKEVDGSELSQTLEFVSNSVPEDKNQEFIKQEEFSQNDNLPVDCVLKDMMPGFSDMKEDAENAMKNDEAILNKIEDGCSDGHTVVLKTPEQIDECDDSKAEFGEQMDQAFNDQGNTIYKESANTEELKDVTESPKNHNQGKVTEPKFTDNSAHTGYIDKLIPDTLGHYDHPETAKAKDEDVMEKESGDGSDASALVADIGYGRVSERREDVHQITSSEDNKVVVQQEKEHLDTNSELKPDDQRQGIECEAESTEVEKALDPDKDTNSSAVRVEDSSDATSESNTEETMVGDNCELDHKQEPTNMFDIREKDVPKKEEAADNIVEKSLSTENMNSAEVISENQIEEKNDETTNANSEVLGYEEKQKFKEASDGDDNTKNGIVTEEDKVSGTTAVRQESEPLIETETIEAEISGRVDQVMKVDAYEYQAYEEKDECKESTNLSIEKSIKNENDEKTSNVLDDLSVNATAPDSPAYRNLQADETDQTTKENYRTTEGIPSEEEHKCEDGEEKDKGIITISNHNIFDIPALDEESEQVETEHEKADDSSCEEQDGEVSRSNLMVQEVGELKEPDELANEAAAEINDRKKNEGEYGPKKEEAFDACPAESSNTGFNERKAAEVEYLSQQPTEKEEAIDGTTEEESENLYVKQVTDAKSISQIDTETMGDTLYAKKISLDKEMQDASVGPTENYAKVDEHNEGNHYKVVGELPVMQELAQESTDAEGEVPHQQNESMDLETNGNPEQSDSIAAHDEEIADRSEPLNIKLQKDKEELMQHEVSSNAMLGSQEITNGIASIQKDIIPEEDAVEAAHEQILEEESKDKKNNEVTVDTVSDDEVKEYDSKQIIIVKDSAENLDTSSSIASLAEEAKQEVGEKFSEISDHQPGEYEKEASGVTGTEAEFSKEMTSGVEKPNVVEQLTFSSADSRAACDTYVKGEDFYVAETSRLDDICKEERQEIKEVSDLEPKEVSEQSVMQEPQVNQPEVIMETEQPTEKASLEIEDNLPVSHFLMKYILQEGGEKVGGDYDGQHEDAMDKNNDGDKKNDVQLIKEQSKSEDKVGFEKLQGIPESVQTEESYDVKEKSETTVVKHDKSLQSTVDESTSITTMTEDGKEEIKTISPVKSIYIDEDCSNKLIPVEKSIQGTSVDSEDCREPDSAQDEKIQGTVLKDTITEMEIQKHNETQDKDFDISVQDNVLEKDSLQKEIGEDSRGCLQDREKVKGACVESDGLSIKNEHNNAEAFEITSEVKKIKCGEEKHDVGNQEQFLKNSSEEKLKLSESQYDQEVDRVTESSIHSLKMAETCLKNDNSEASLDKEQLETTNSKVEENNIDEETCETKEEEQKPEKTGLDETGLAYTINDHVLGEITGVQSEGKQVEDFEKVQEATNQNQVQVGNDTTKEMKLAESLEVQQLDLAADSSTQPEQMAEKSLKEGSSAVNADENYPAQTTDTKVDEDKTDAEKDGKEDEQEHNPEDYDHNAEIKVEDRDAELKPAQKKSHGLLSGVGSKVKHSIAKVKKAITGKSSHSKTLSAK
ncbi:uncharacterized protein A4U43_C01F26820 [Asparagus officinalis]|uniref:Uncharacterized protein n=1 Tax=Asparagus officinalis TaxID=4686 RepID=A0A5P1FT93_ASPOF|nr:uncharacterized protein A4U43_C01F26820 [Asparagus officinalis]